MCFYMAKAIANLKQKGGGDVAIHIDPIGDICRRAHH